MKQLLVVCLAGALILSGCAMATIGGSFVSGFIYSDYSGPMLATGSTAGFNKMGQSEVKSILGWVAVGDASIQTAARNGGISKVHHVDFHTMSILSVYSVTTVTVYGE